MTNKEVLTEYVYQMISALSSYGVKDVVISPGSRSTPLAYAFASSKEFRIVRHVDERSAGFLALGMAKTASAPVVLLCTSGTAAANYFPAIVEAYYARIPLIVLTADRPHELRGVGAPQAIDQPNLYGHHVKWTVDLPIPDGESPTLPHIERHMARATSLAMTSPRGPVHINVPFREPLLIHFKDELPAITFNQADLAELTPTARGIDLLEQAIKSAEKGFLIIGEMDQSVSQDILWSFIRHLKWPVLVESLSHLRSNIPEDCMMYIVEHYDSILKNDLFKQHMAPDTVIRFGAQPVSKPLTLFMKAVKPATIITVDEDALFRDPLAVTTNHIQAQLGEWLTTVDCFDQIFEKDYLMKWLAANDIATQFVKQYIQNEQDEGALAGLLFERLEDGADLFASSSMPIRDVDTFFCKTEKDVQVFANRGTNGIDGVVSTAIGTQLVTNRELYLLIGDLSFLHDSNGLIASRYQDVNLTVVVMNNDGGGIFSYLAQSTVEAHFEQLFGTATGLTFDHLAAMYDAQYDVVKSKEEFIAAIHTSKKKPLRIIEVMTDRQENVVTHRKLWTAMGEELNKLWQV
ncbi:2-succinyl-5-enolpyruvyl-6-hydroxy-3-cyclohexene-1-carboxylate synthase [Kurthia zopfii]|uniref:2-succinyl-5-enolpyruvyl-6-hydroxy-3-cyclohexene-1-carboxylate synthase n=1 Tax=Kurthia zopfii TaxID=1650 RepID=A0A2U3A9F4_9BACL|nr:2-succinyl-5-enolpyruvyl-6-hydroxy-3-cyclohexene-1-carboxylic-acid synthase [Kurthia zopfii]PWI21183.1 2-succinyl-5-enolpyruvyl-6-hydroxy-3-cyclohexene-1-carboxylic-acid synthase [Kurthia zopfii]TDR33294.1 2-succinyl-5-enolpyruvyl-6-hydroxy-3-cyclohexene-1-carboxylate synthase [Kurthia zopfii]STX10406.1 2-succinyl-5-enolpyruvyl-6-hydroxy-3-cyclohexene-1-carboxylate synthase [Kurthia zopfii]VEI08608.1 2-succinyl-5-enolpyruvyl-6-hydroxy-3-cyclohexene-1-carboxylate synthase [Kurthia zopfii]GEK